MSEKGGRPKMTDEDKAERKQQLAEDRALVEQATKILGSRAELARRLGVARTRVGNVVAKPGAKHAETLTRRQREAVRAIIAANGAVPGAAKNSTR